MNTMTMNKKDAVLSCIKNDKRLLTGPASAIVSAVKRQHRIDISENYASTIRKEYKDNMHNNGQEPAVTLPEPAPSALPLPEESEAPLESANVATIDFRTVDTACNLMCEVRAIAVKVGGLDNLIVLTQKMQNMGIR